MKCILCDAEDRFELRYAKGGYDIVACRECGLTQLSPTPDAQALLAVYNDEYFASDESGRGYSDYAEQEDEYMATFADDVRRISEIVPRGRVLDVGCGYGYFLHCAAAAGYDCYGVDVADKAVRMAETHLPGRVFAGTPASVDALRGMRFDVIFGSHLIEHIPDPRAFVADLAARLNPNGILVFVTPNIRSLLARVSRSRWVSFKIPEHVAFYDPRTIGRLFENAGLRTLAVESAYQHYRLPFVATKVRSLIRPLDRLVPPVERLPGLRDRIVRVTSGSLRAIARPRG
jgi:SAM-dependent methyltransferase